MTEFDPYEKVDNFLLKDFCSIVGVEYQPEYCEAIVRSLVRKDLTFYKWLFNTYIQLPLEVSITRGLSESDVIVTHTDSSFRPGSLEVAVTDAQYYYENGHFIYLNTASRLYTDMVVRSNASLLISVSSRLQEEFFSRFTKYSDLFLLVLPARLFVRFLFV